MLSSRGRQWDQQAALERQQEKVMCGALLAATKLILFNDIKLQLHGVVKGKLNCVMHPKKGYYAMKTLRKQETTFYLSQMICLSTTFRSVEGINRAKPQHLTTKPTITSVIFPLYNPRRK